jgi:outer membrane immunogenic protein
MRSMARGLLVGASLLALAGAASAADLSRPTYKAAPPPPPAWSWTGFYIGAHVGAGWSTTEADITSISAGGLGAFGAQFPLSSHNNNGFLGGGQVGFNWQAGWVVIGAEVDAAATDIKGHAPCLVVLSCSTKHDWLVTAAGRLGVTWDRTLVYVKGGAAWADSEYSANLALGGLAFTANVNDTRVGALFGAGVEQGIAGGWSAKVEYNFIDFGTENYAVPLAVGIPVTVNTDITEKLHIVKFGLNYRFGFDPIVARY